MGCSIHEHFKNGAYEARLMLGERSYATLCQIAQNHDWQNESLDLNGIIGRLISTDAKYSNLLSLNKLDQ